MQLEIFKQGLEYLLVKYKVCVNKCVYVHVCKVGLNRSYSKVSHG